MRALCSLFVLSLALLVTPSVHAGARELAPHEANGYFDDFLRLGLDVHRIFGEAPARTFSRPGFALRCDLYGFLATTRYDTLLGGEVSLAAGARRADGADVWGESPWKGFLRWDAAMDYAVLHWGGILPGRVVIGAGGGFDVDAGASYAKGGRVYPLVLGRLQLWPSDDLALHLSWHHLPVANTGTPWGVREHRFELSIASHDFSTTLRYTSTRILRDDRPSLSTSELGVMVGYAF
jgi:hypothetical protein